MHSTDRDYTHFFKLFFDHSMTPVFKLIYFDLPGRAEVVRLVLAQSGLPWEDIRLSSKEEFDAIKPKAPFGQLPILEFNGRTYAQTLSLCRFIARKSNLAGENESNATECDMWVEYCMEAIVDNLKKDHAEGDEKEAAGRKFEATVPDVLERVTKRLKEQKGNSFLVGRRISWADIVLFHLLEWLVEDKPDALDGMFVVV
ncbi:unnamed protein product [Cyprideis torosa]|uniref:Uncharacterized protein n=1 Tax=Cyprideis torosa TaxID=163714 RepID=A0A7R8W977_9CRUS|nr:unnamed protein product [Cyprideis torosa]CAG0889500.1 unnamed protein product [Cyprideis torosa]